MNSIRLRLGHEHACGYLDDRLARSVFVDPALTLSPQIYSALARKGFRRSGDLVYRPRCRGCNACIPVRLDVARFAPDRSQRRNQQRNRDLRAQPTPPVFNETHYRLFTRYQDSRHAGGGMTAMNRRDYLGFLASSWSSSQFVEFRDNDEKLLGVAVVDRLEDGLSAVYTFFDPDESQRGIGTHAVLWQITEAQRLRLPWLYLGYWIAESRKMAYKSRFRPLQALHGERWEEIEE
ncbi:MAG: arginyltransferase [Methylococcaceae bacterium]|nr:arginyltransferase [Methylococcaceae bacterium]